jgi:fumarate reductase (CoM/CoB) subunit A
MEYQIIRWAMQPHKVYNTDVLVIGGGGAAASAAIGAAEQGADVILVDKKTFGRSGSSGIHPGLLMASPITAGDSIETHINDTIRGGDFLGNHQLVKILAEGARKEISALERYGNILRRNENGEPIAYQMGGHSVGRSFSPGFMWQIANFARSHDIRVIEETMITNILAHNGKAVGATAVDLKSGEFYVLRAKSTVLATGGAGQIYGWSTVAAHSTNPIEVTGDGQAMAYRIGTELIDMEFIQFLVYQNYPPQFVGGLVGADASMKDVIFDNRGVNWMKDIPLQEMTRARLIKEIALRIKNGRGTPHNGVFVDCSSVLEYLGEDVIHAKRLGYNLSEERIEISPSCHHFMGGVLIDGKCQATLPGLYACGEVAGGIHGSNRLGSNAHADILVFGKRAGQFAAKNALKTEKPGIDWNLVESEQDRVCDVLNRTPRDAVKVNEIRHQLQSLMWEKAGPLRTEEELNDGVEKIKTLKRMLPRMHVSLKTKTYNLEWFEALELHNMVDCAEMVLRAAIMRKESRGAHQRIDFPDKDEKNWRLNIIISRADGEMHLEKRVRN